MEAVVAGKWCVVAGLGLGGFGLQVGAVSCPIGWRFKAAFGGLIWGCLVEVVWPGCRGCADMGA
ncbi:hypothetical protein BVRB_7g180410 [Beta vulgaris subsp. vulgaris]|uniref:Uncharacterized protein n=1 Tax=Beta vulgaris subsp. vulgaris TaxID=3555 RepID=A0A0J8B6N3_BETVV|nr:hypothetical protein BVRB_7g180410 [Beta vulgaris subsp. vulgaris]